MKNILYLFFMVFLNFSYGIQPVELLKGTNKLFSESYKGWAPLAGASLWYSGWINGLYTYGDSAHAMVQLVRQLFHDQVGDIAPSKSLNNPPFRVMHKGLLPDVIGMISHANVCDAAFKQKFIEQLVAGYDEYVSESEGITDRKKIAKKMRRLRNQAKNFVDIIEAASYEEDSGLYPSHTLEQVFSAYWFALLHKEYDPKASIELYMSHFNFSISPQNYTSDELQMTNQIIASGSSQEISDMLTDIEKTSVARLTDIVSPAGFPPLVLYDSYRYGSFLQKAPHCVEAMLLNLFNFLLYNSETKSYDLTLIPSMNERVRSFYAQMNTRNVSHLLASNTNLSETKKAWMDAMSNIAEGGIDYKMHDQYAMISNLPNIIRICNVLFNAHISNLSQLGEFLTKQMVGREVRIRELNLSCYKVSVYDKDIERSMLLHIRDWHSWCEPITVKNELRSQLVTLLNDSFEHRQLKLCVDNPLPSATSLPLLEYIMYSKSLDNEDLLANYIIMMIERIKAEGTFVQHASRLLRWMFRLSPEETPPINNTKVRVALVGITDEVKLEKFLNYFDEYKNNLETIEEEILCANKFVL